MIDDLAEIRKLLHNWYARIIHPEYILMSPVKTATCKFGTTEVFSTVRLTTRIIMAEEVSPVPSKLETLA